MVVSGEKLVQTCKLDLIADNHSIAAELLSTIMCHVSKHKACD